jgi:large subunit ribosomal protein L15
MRIPKLRGFKNRAKVHYEIVNVGDIAARIEAGAFATGGTAPKKGEALTINADVLRAVGLVRDVRRPLKILGNGDLSTALFVVADAFTKSATEKIEAAGGSVNVLEVPAESRPALGVDGEAVVRPARVARTAEGRAAAERKADARARRDADTAEAEAIAAAPRPERAPKAKAAASAAELDEDAEAVAESGAAAEPEATASVEPVRKRATGRAAKAAVEAADANVETDADATTGDEAEAVEPADAPDAIDETAADARAGDDTESDSAVPGDDA